MSGLNDSSEALISNDINELHNKEMISIMIYHLLGEKNYVQQFLHIIGVECDVMLHIKRVINGSQGIFIPL